MKIALIITLFMGLALSTASAISWVEHTTEENQLQSIEPTGKTALELPHQFNVLVWNCHKGGDYGWAEDFTRLDQQSDITLLQELYSTDLMMDEMHRTGKEVIMGYTFKRKGSFTGVATLSNIRSTAQIPIKTLDSEPLIHSKKMTMVTVYPIVDRDEKLMVVNIHAINFVRSKTFAKELDHIYSIIKEHQGPMIFAGDFNTWTKERNQKMAAIMAKLGLKKLPLNGKTMVSRGFELDHIFYRGLSATHGEVYRNLVSSDHFPITTTFQVL